MKKVLLTLALSTMMAGCPSISENCDELEVCCRALLELDPPECRQARDTEAQCLRGIEAIRLRFPALPEECR